MALTALDAALLLMVLVWGCNFSIVKIALRDFPELAFNAMRMAVAAIVFLVAIWWTRHAEPRTPQNPSEPLRTLPNPSEPFRTFLNLSKADWTRLAILGVVGHFLYQFMFVGGVKRTSVGNSSLIVGASPVVIAWLSSLAGHERVPPLRWLGVFLALTGLYFVVGHRVDWSAESRLGDALIMGAMLFWATYSVAAQPLLKTHSPLVVTGVSLSIGAFLFLVTTSPFLLTVDWSSISLVSWLLMLVSAVLAVNLAYLIWYTGVQKLGGTRTAVYSYLTPIVAMIVAALWLGEPVSGNQMIGAGAILTGLVITRFAS